MSHSRLPLVIALLAGALGTLLSPVPGRAETLSEPRTIEGGLQIWFSETSGWVRAHVGPRWSRGMFSIRPHAALGPSFLPGVAGQPIALGAYVDAELRIPIDERRAVQLGPGGGLGHIIGLGAVTGRQFIAQGYGQVAYRWDENLVGIMFLGGPSYDWEHGGVDRLRFRGLGLRFEYQIGARPRDQLF
jgi:hypothetical protein